MKWNPYINGVVAVAYIGVLVLFLHFIESLRHDTPDTVIDGIAAISLFTFSASLMGFLLFYQPLVRLVEGKRIDALSYFLKTLSVFGVITVVMLSLALIE